MDPYKQCSVGMRLSQQWSRPRVSQNAGMATLQRAERHQLLAGKASYSLLKAQLSLLGAELFMLLAGVPASDTHSLPPGASAPLLSLGGEEGCQGSLARTGPAGGTLPGGDRHGEPIPLPIPRRGASCQGLSGLRPRGSPGTDFRAQESKLRAGGLAPPFLDKMT